MPFRSVAHLHLSDTVKQKGEAIVQVNVQDKSVSMSAVEITAESIALVERGAK